MARPTTKTDLIAQAVLNYEKMRKFIDTMPWDALNTEFDFSDDTKKTEAHWLRDRNLRDVLVHLHEWHKLLLNWVHANMAGSEQPFLPQPYNWKTYGEMNMEFWKKHQNTPLEEAGTLLEDSHSAVLELLETFSSEELFTKRYYTWTGTTSLGSYCVSALSAHYAWAIQKLRAHAKKFQS